MNKSIKIIIVLITIIIVSIAGILILNLKNQKAKAPSHDDIINEIYYQESLKTDNQELKKSNLNIRVLGKSIKLPFDFEYLTQNGYTFVDSEDEQKVYSAEDEKISMVVMTSEDQNAKLETMYGSPYLNFNLLCGKNSANSFKNITVVGFTILSGAEKKHLSVNGFGYDDSMEDIIKSIGNDYVELVGKYDQNIETGDYHISYSYSDLTVDIKSEDGLIKLISVNKVD